MVKWQHGNASIELDENIVIVRGPDGAETHRCATHRVAKAFALRKRLEVSGWTISGISSRYARRAMLLPGEKMFQLLDGSLSDQRAQGFDARRDDAYLCFDLTFGLRPEIVHWHNSDQCHDAIAMARDIFPDITP